MGASSEPFCALQEDLSWFIGCPEIRVMHITTGGEERPVVLHQVALAEGNPYNRSPFFVLEDAHTNDDPGWSVRAERMRLIHEARREAMVKEGYSLHLLPPLAHDARDIVTFGRQIHQCLLAQAAVPELSGLVLVLAPGVLEAPNDFAGAVLELLRVQAFAQVRIIVIELGNALVKPLMHQVADAGLSATCIVDKERSRQEYGAKLAAMARAPAAASAEVQSGFAGPKDVCAPPRHGQPPRDVALPPEVTEALAAATGPMAGLAGAAGKLLKQRIAGAAFAMQEQRYPDAIRLQTEACAQCLELGIPNLACVLEISLAVYIFQAGARARAITAFESAAARARAANLLELESQALMGLANVHMLDRRLADAAHVYARAGDAAERGQSLPLAIEAFRMAGQLALQSGGESAAVAAWQRALRIASSTAPEMAAASSAPLVARSLAKVYRDHGSLPAAQSLLDQADNYERAKATPEKSPAARPSPPGADAARGAGHVPAGGDDALGVTDVRG
ncbi:tetratricopeptide repeat protein [Pendulispora albinea]|uniref:MalT-like TPR region domain-containing protein n=1 Tax=Pendulispora albinea TaxID=2741071 RepID=A0ABZ2LX07_9BACT